MKSTEKAVTNNKVILNLIQDLQRLPLLLVNNMRGRFQIKFGMTSLFNNSAFTLIELLVVVLIIGILAAVAVPQYKQAVAKARTAEALAMLKTLVDAQSVYYLTNGTGTTEIDKLDVGIPSSQIASDHAKADPNQPNVYMYSCTTEGGCIANACNPDMPLLHYLNKYMSNSGGFWCVPYTWTENCEQKNAIAENICKSMNGSGETSDYKGLTTYYRIN